MKKQKQRKLIKKLRLEKQMKTPVSTPHTVGLRTTAKQRKGTTNERAVVTKPTVSIPSENKRSHAKKLFTEISDEERIGKYANKREKGKGKMKSTKAGSAENNQSLAKMSTDISDESCKLCKFIYKQPDDPKADEEWLGCSKCQSWFHFSCAEGYGILDDENFTCRPCV